MVKTTKIHFEHVKYIYVYTRAVGKRGMRLTSLNKSCSSYAHIAAILQFISNNTLLFKKGMAYCTAQATSWWAHTPTAAVFQLTSHQRWIWGWSACGGWKKSLCRPLCRAPPSIGSIPSSRPALSWRPNKISKKRTIFGWTINNKIKNWPPTNTRLNCHEMGACVFVEIPTKTKQPSDGIVSVRSRPKFLLGVAGVWVAVVNCMFFRRGGRFGRLHVCFLVNGEDK